ncbi:hypothetical protein [Microbulbifer thermotolerans]|uniref:Uncharacterized protein n=1 Tax=Microbulbifer thermotolerans TaxID=252514 RepID=A0A143HJ09_MICTH|nr:hypothetical protein [Microbulbifer thermotolerans]AMX01698.1 hypothetical protein A3224_03085 [Microbulbifer thermotolerans]MCX2779467.1 hypothetical protein [Microbulbifer thermotolerans]MCX2793338.1 hypothetical protein [Microbulbifer thermotolerans]MCX2801277.1 hypothetical protein [Microbulbifer thermotolerans]MCX2806088.1 hypothetical protein [Microbulbifer thermotolerans]
MKRIALSLAALITITPALSALAVETLQLKIVTPSGDSYEVQQALGKEFESFASGVITAETAPREYLAIRCDGPWGATKYRVPLHSGPGYLLRAKGKRLLLQIVEHVVISEDETIAAMSVHCIDTKPRQVVKSVAEVELERGSSATQRLQLANDYLLEYHYTP